MAYFLDQKEIKRYELADGYDPNSSEPFQDRKRCRITKRDWDAGIERLAKFGVEVHDYTDENYPTETWHVEREFTLEWRDVSGEQKPFRVWTWKVDSTKQAIATETARITGHFLELNAINPKAFVMAAEERIYASEYREKIWYKGFRGDVFAKLYSDYLDDCHDTYKKRKAGRDSEPWPASVAKPKWLAEEDGDV